MTLRWAREFVNTWGKFSLVFILDLNAVEGYVAPTSALWRTSWMESSIGILRAVK